MKRSMISILLVVALMGCTQCASLQSVWNGDTDAMSVKTALCQDAQLGLAIWTVMSEGSTPEAQAYWTAYRRGVDLAIKTYCVGV